MTKIKIGGQKYNLEDLPETFRNRILSELEKEGIKYDEEDKIRDDGKSVKVEECKNKKKIDVVKSDKIKKKTGRKEDMSFFRKMFGYP